MKGGHEYREESQPSLKVRHWSPVVTLVAASRGHVTWRVRRDDNICWPAIRLSTAGATTTRIDHKAGAAVGPPPVTISWLPVTQYFSDACTTHILVSTQRGGPPACCTKIKETSSRRDKAVQVSRTGEVRPGLSHIRVLGDKARWVGWRVREKNLEDGQEVLPLMLQ